VKPVHERLPFRDCVFYATVRYCAITFSRILNRWRLSVYVSRRGPHHPGGSRVRDQDPLGQIAVALLIAFAVVWAVTRPMLMRVSAMTPRPTRCIPPVVGRILTFHHAQDDWPSQPVGEMYAVQAKLAEFTWQGGNGRGPTQSRRRESHAFLPLSDRGSEAAATRHGALLPAVKNHTEDGDTFLG
jgi:hypothetical protein